MTIDAAAIRPARGTQLLRISFQASPLSPSPRVSSLGFDPNSLGSEVLQDEAKRRPLRAPAKSSPMLMRAGGSSEP